MEALKKKYTLVKCTNCNKLSKAKRSWQKFCSSNCRFAYWAKYHPRIKINDV